MSYLKSLGSLVLAGSVGLCGCSMNGSAGGSSPRASSDGGGGSGPDYRGGSAPASGQIIGHADGGTDVRRASARQPQEGGGSTASAGGGLRYTLAYPTGARESSLIMLEADGPQQVRVGQPFNYTLRVTNLTDTPLHGVSVDDYARPTEGGPMVDHEHGGNAMPAAAAMGPTTRPAARVQSAAWDVGTLAPHETKTHQVNGVADEVGSLRSCLSVSYTPTLCTAINVVRPELQLTKEGPSDVLVCQNIAYRYVVTNTGSGVATGVRIRDTLPDGLTTADGNQRDVSLNVGDLRAGESKQATVAVRAARTGQFASRATATSGSGPDAVESQSRQVSTTVREPVLATSVEAPESRYVGEPVDFRVTVRNTGDATAERAVVHLVSAGGERLGDRDLGTIGVGESRTVPISLRAPQAGGELRLTASAEAQCARPAAAGTTVAILTVPALLLEAVDSVDPIRVGGSTVYTITVLNQGTGPDHNVRIRATLPPEEQYVTGRGASEVTADGQTLTMAPIATLEPKQSVTWKVEVKGTRPGDTRFNVDLTSDSLTRPATKSESTRIVSESGKPAGTEENR